MRNRCRHGAAPDMQQGLPWGASAERRHRLAGQAGDAGRGRLGGRRFRQAREVRVRAVLLHPLPASRLTTRQGLLTARWTVLHRPPLALVAIELQKVWQG